MASNLDKAKLRNSVILKAALDEALQHGFTSVTRDGVARRAAVAMGTVNNAFGDIELLKNALVIYCIKYEVLSILAQAIAAGNATAINADPDLKARAVQTLLT